MNGFECGCERGDDCTKTTMCHIQSVVEDKDTIIEAAKDLCPKVGYHHNDAHWAVYDKLHTLLWGE